MITVSFAASLLLALLLFDCSGKDELKTESGKPADSMSIDKIDSLLTETAVSPDTTFLIPDSSSPEAKILPLSNYMDASKELLKWAESPKMDKDLRKEVKTPDKITIFLEKYITSIVKKHGFANRIHYLYNENNHVAQSREARNISDQIQQALNQKITPYISDSLLSDKQKKEKRELVTKLITAYNLLKSEKYTAKIKEFLKKKYEQEAFDKINEELFTESGFSSYSEAMEKIGEFRQDPEVQNYIIALDKVANEMLDKSKK